MMMPMPGDLRGRYALRLTVLGGALLLLGVVANPWFIERALSADHEIRSRAFRGLLLVGDAVLVAAGLALIALRSLREKLLRSVEEAPQPGRMGRRVLLIVGWSSILAGLLLNEWLVASALITNNGDLPRGVRLAIWAVDLLFLGVGYIVLAFLPAIHKYREGLAISFVTVIIALAGLEGLSRLWLFKMADDPQFLRYASYGQVADRGWATTMSDPFAVYRHVPGYESPDGLNRHNSFGFRGVDVQAPKPPGTFRIVTVGGSATYDVGIDDWRLTYAAQLGSILRQQYGCVSVEVINAGVSGYDSFLLLRQLPSRVLGLQPDLIIYNESFNDISARYVDHAAYQDDGSGRVSAWRTYPGGALVRHSVLMQVTVARLGLPPKRTLVDAVFRNKAYHPEFTLAANDAEAARLLGENPPLYFESNLKDYIALARQRGIQVLLATYAHSPVAAKGLLNDATQQEIGKQNQLIQQIALGQKTPFFDLASKMPAEADYWWDHTHTTEQGARIKAELFAQALVSQGLLPADCR